MYQVQNVKIGRLPHYDTYVRHVVTIDAMIQAVDIGQNLIPAH